MLFEDDEVMIHIKVDKKPEIVKFDEKVFKNIDIIHVDGSCTGAKKRRGMVFVSTNKRDYNMTHKSYVSLIRQCKIEGYLLYDEIDNHWDQYEGFDLNTAKNILNELN
jgi:hypothetical protein